MKKGNKGVAFAWFMLVILVSFLGVLVYVKHFMPKDDQEPPVVITNVVDSNYIVERFNSSSNITLLNQNGTIVRASFNNENKIIINYQKDDIIRNYDVTINNNILTIVCDKTLEDKQNIKEFFMVLVDSANQYFGQKEGDTYDTIKQFTDYNRELKGLGYRENDVNYSYSADIGKALTLYVPKNTYTSFTLIAKMDTDYQIVMNDYGISSVKFENGIEDNSYIMMEITNNLQNERTGKVTIQLYDINNNVIWSNKDNLASASFTSEENKYKLNVTIPDNIDFDVFAKYSIVIE